MHGFVRNLITEWRRLELPFAGESIIVAVSGGADSVSLLLAVNDLVRRKKLGHRVIAAHFNHALRAGESDADEEFVRELTTRLGIELATGRGNLATDGNLEQNARDARYEFLRKTAGNVDASAVLTGHTINDQAETFLLNLIRGSGPDGLGGMRTIRILEGETRKRGEREKGRKGEREGRIAPSPPLPFSPSLLLVRPLLSWARRSDTETFCHDLGVEYRYDTMNGDTAFKRVRIRKILLPLLADMNPKIVETLANTANLMQKVSDITANGNQSPIADELVVREMGILTQAELYLQIRRWLEHHRGSMRQLELKHIEAVERLAFSGKSGRRVELPGGATVSKSGGKLVYHENKVENSDTDI